MADNGVHSIFKRLQVDLKLEITGIIIGYRKRDRRTGLYSFPNLPTDNTEILMASINDSTDLCHRRLGDMNSKDLCSMHLDADGIPELPKLKGIYRACKIGKAHRFPCTGNFRQTNSVGEVVHSYIMGPFVKSYSDKYCYLVTLQDDYSRFLFVGVMRNKAISFLFSKVSSPYLQIWYRGAFKTLAFVRTK